MPESDLRAIQDRLEIEELLHRYAEMVDFRQWKEMDRIFALEATIDYVSSGGVAGPFRETLAWLDRALEGGVGVRNAVVRLVLVAQPEEDLDRLLLAGRVDQDRLEAPLERPVLLDVLAVLVERGGADALHLAST